MTFLDQDQSVHDSEPIECYLFTGPNFIIGYNDSEDDFTVNGQLYTSIEGLGRGDIETGVSIGADRSVRISVPFNCEVALQFGYLLTPDYLNVQIIRIERGTVYDTDHEVIWLGEAVGFQTSGLLIDIATASSAQQSIQRQLLTSYWQRTCNFDHYDSDTCKANKAANTTTSTVTIIGSEAITVADDGFPDGELAIGQAVNTRTGEARLITDNLANVISLAYGFNDVLVGDTVNLIRGCKHTSDDCINTFNNLENYGGFRFIPRTSPLAS